MEVYVAATYTTKTGYRIVGVFSSREQAVKIAGYKTAKAGVGCIFYKVVVDENYEVPFLDAMFWFGAPGPTGPDYQ